jgi:hypothetical protein
MKLPTVVLGALLCGIAAPSHAQAADRHFYVGVDLGQGRIDRQYPGYTESPGSNAESFAWKLRFGWRLSPHWSFEAGYTDFGDYDGALMFAYPTLLPLVDPGSAIFAAGDFSTSAKGLDVSAVGTWPIGESFYLCATAGLMRREMKSTHDPYTPGTPAFRAKDGDLAAQYGVGFGFRLSEAWDLGVNWVTTSNLEGDFEFLENQSDPGMLSVGVSYRL